MSRRTVFTSRGTLYIMIGMETNTQKFLRECRAIWREENARCFNGKLKAMPYFSVDNTADFGALCMNGHTKNGRDKFVINRKAKCNATKKGLRSIIVHEMVHSEQWQHPSRYINREHHGRFFRRRAKEILAITGFDVVAMYPKKGTPGFFLTIQPE